MQPPGHALWFKDDEDLFEKARDEMLETLGARQADLQTTDQGDFGQRLDCVVPRRLNEPPRRARAWFALFDDKLVAVTALVPSEQKDAEHRFSKTRPDAVTRARR